PKRPHPKHPQRTPRSPVEPMVQIAIYPGSFDPPTFGHLDLVERASHLFPKLIVALGHHSGRKSLFTEGERLELLERVCARYPNVVVTQFEGLLVEYARKMNARV